MDETTTRELIKLHTMGPRWYAGYREGNITIGGMFGAPTIFPRTMSKDEVIAEIKKQDPDIVINI